MTATRWMTGLWMMLAPMVAAADDDHDDELADTFDPDVKPEAPRPELPDADGTEVYAGVGSGVAYSTQGTGEFGGAMSFATSPDVLSFSADPMVGYFVFDNIQLSGILGYRHVTVDDASSNRFSALVEPSLHLPITNGLFWAGGLGMGAAFTDGIVDDRFTGGVALAPRTGLQVLIGRSGLLNVGGRYSMVFSDVDTDLEPATGQATLVFANTFEIQAGYTVMF